VLQLAEYPIDAFLHAITTTIAGSIHVFARFACLQPCLTWVPAGQHDRLKSSRQLDVEDPVVPVLPRPAAHASDAKPHVKATSDSPFHAHFAVTTIPDPAVAGSGIALP
jgi:hypothetical protein